MTGHPLGGPFACLGNDRCDAAEKVASLSGHAYAGFAT